jgi:outer membrane receptor for ferrienterochelin and colicins
MYIKYLITLLFWSYLYQLHGQEILYIPVSGACGMCKDRIEGVALQTIGVNKAKYDLKKQELAIDVSPLFVRKELNDKLLQAGHDNDGLKASDQAYADLHTCCKYREAEEKDPFVREITGAVFERTEKGDLIPAIGATLVWAGTGEGAVTDLNGEFVLPVHLKTNLIILSYVGYNPDTMEIKNGLGYMKLILQDHVVMDAVEIKHRRRTTEISYLDPVKTLQISQKELLKAACCNLAESFDTTPAIDATTTDAVTGTRKIEMLGLAGPYVQITRENIPDIRGLAAVQGLAFTPGPWVEGMQLNMGAGSVVNGFESLTGQINVELRKPCHEDLLFLNGYANAQGRYEFNYFSKNTLSDRWSTANLIHGSTRSMRNDQNEDGFLDMPLTKQLGWVNRWKYTNNDGQEGQIGVKLSYMDNISGQTDFVPGRSDRNSVWGADMVTSRLEVWGKRGFVNLDTPEKTLGLQFSGVYHDQKAIFGTRTYDATQKSLYFNAIHQNTIVSKDHQVRVGASFQWDEYHELVSTTNYHRNEWVPGAFAEYTYKGSEKFTLLMGIRGDYHNQFGFFATPRLNVRYSPAETTVLRLSAGRGQRTESIFAENIGLFASSRQIRIEGNNPNTPYGLGVEVAWNAGFSLTQDIDVYDRLVQVSVDLNRIEFENQIVVDYETPGIVSFYNLKGQSYSNSGQIQIEIGAADWLDLRVAYRYNDVRTTYGETLLRKPLASPQRAFINWAMDFGKGWKWDFTINWLSSSRLPSGGNRDIYPWKSEAPAYFMANSQLSKSWKNNFEWYIGAENLTGYRMKNPIIASDMPFSPYFDGSMIWGPIMGANVYVGFRYNLPQS